MKINRVKAEKKERKLNKGSFFANLFYFFELYRFLVAIIIGLATASLLVVLVLDLTIPNELENVDMKTTLKLFDQLQEAGRHQDAIVLMEYKGDLLKNHPEQQMEYKLKLSESYIHVGDYSKAEKMLLDVWKSAPKHLEKIDDVNTVNFFMFSIARNIYQLYEKSGDKKNQIKYFDIYKSYYNKCNKRKLKEYFSKLNKKSKRNNFEDLNIDELIEYDSIVILSLSDKENACDKMEKYVEKILPRNNYGISYKIKCLNKLIGWMLEKGNYPEAYERCAQAIYLAKQIRPTDQHEVLGDLSDLCYTVHDVELSKTLYLQYQDYLDEYYSETDEEYLKNRVRSLRYLEYEGKLDELIEHLTSYCVGMRQQIAKNIPSMTEEQREHFAEQFEWPYKYTIHILQKHPEDERLANLCFDNIVFKNGLLLRSNISIENSIKQLGDRDLINKYEELKKCRRELVYQSISGKRFFTNTESLKDKIAILEKELALASTDFKTKNEIIEIGHEQIQNELTSSEAVINLVEDEGKLFALLLIKNQPVCYISIGDSLQIKDRLRKPIDEVYHDPELTHILWNKVEDKLKGCNDIYYTPVGLFTQISLGSLYLGENRYLCDNNNFRLLSNPADIIGYKELNLADNMRSASLWGGIDYGPGMEESSNLAHTTRSSIKRGDNLVILRYAQREVGDISAMLDANNITNTIYSGSQASETAFKERSGSGDCIIHISTHGFFNDSVDMKRSMLLSGLFFAGANKYWSNDTIQCEPGQEDGILRAAEISNLNLSGCSLVVLSACETGLGYSDSSEGVYGLQRAFKLAGARQILMSLWDVDDSATKLLMTEFYKNLLNGMSTDDALENSKRIVRQSYPSPKDWGAFVLLH